jgi:carbon storage regulator
MLVLTRKRGERVLIGEEVEITVLEIRGNRVHLGFRGPAEVPIHREELHRKMGTSQPAHHQAECA